MSDLGCRFGFHQGHRRGQFFADDGNVYRCERSDKRTDYEYSVTVARFALKKHAKEWAAMMNRGAKP